MRNHFTAHLNHSNTHRSIRLKLIQTVNGVCKFLSENIRVTIHFNQKGYYAAENWNYFLTLNFYCLKVINIFSNRLYVFPIQKKNTQLTIDYHY